MRLLLLGAAVCAQGAFPGLAAPVRAQAIDASVDVLDYRFELVLSDTSDEIEGRAAIGFRVLRAVSEVEFDLDDPDGEAGGVDAPGDGVRPAGGMVVSAVALAEPIGTTSEAGRSLSFRQEDDRLHVHLGREAGAGQVLRIEVRYHGVPADGLTIGVNRHGDRTFFADNWPNRAHHWLPVVDHPSDKALVSFAVTAPAHYQVVATGAFVSAIDLEGGLRRTEWRSRAPVATKVIAIGAARFVRHRQAVVDGVPVETWVYPQDREAGLPGVRAGRPGGGHVRAAAGRVPVRQARQRADDDPLGRPGERGQRVLPRGRDRPGGRDRDPDRARNRSPVVRRRGDPRATGRMSG